MALLRQPETVTVLLELFGGRGCWGLLNCGTAFAVFLVLVVCYFCLTFVPVVEK
jgi:hypothetical protein